MIAENQERRISPAMVSLRVTIQVIIALIAILVRAFSSVRYESVIHEFDPYFNYRATLRLTEGGFTNLFAWEDTAWYPIGRQFRAMYPGLMVTAALIHRGCTAIGLAIDIREICVLIGSITGALSTLVAYGLGSELRDPVTGLLAAAFVAVCPGYISRSVAGSYDYESIAIFTMLACYWLFCRAVRRGSLATGLLSGLIFAWMANSWGGAVFIMNYIPFFAVVGSLFFGLYSSNLLRAYVGWYAVAVPAMLLVDGPNVLLRSDNLAAHLALLFIGGVAVLKTVRGLAPSTRVYLAAMKPVGVSFLALVGVVLLLLELGGLRSPIVGRVYSFLDPTYARKHIPIIASVSEHQPMPAGQWFFDIHLLAMALPAGMYLCFMRPTADAQAGGRRPRMSSARVFMAVFTICTVWFTGVMIRMVLVTAPTAAVVGALPLAELLRAAVARLDRALAKHDSPSPSPSSSRSSSPAKRAGPSKRRPYAAPVAALVLAAAVLGVGTTTFLILRHGTWAASDVYSSPSIVLTAGKKDPKTGRAFWFDDFRESYQFIEHNTDPRARLLSWWDYGYQIASMANRTVITDNNTVYTRHIARTARALALPEEQSWQISRELDADYVLVVFGGAAGYSSDDIAKFIWPVRIADAAFHDTPEKNFVGPMGYSIGHDAPQTFKDSMVYKFCYYRFNEMVPSGMDVVRRTRPGYIPPAGSLKRYKEVFTSAHGFVRVYKVLPPRPFAELPSTRDSLIV